jgi:CBS domain-containing protein
MKTVREVMSTALVTVNPSAMMSEAARVMSEAGVGSALVLDGDSLVGIFTERDILRVFEQMHADPGRVAPVSNRMTRDPETINPDASVGTAMDLMLERGFRPCR